MDLILLIQYLFELLGIHEFLPSGKFIRLLADTVCSQEVSRYLCENVVFLIAGFDYQQLNVVGIIQCSIVYIYASSVVSFF